jgi:hypothetical protein
MAVFLITYDLVAEDSGYDYKPLLARLRELGGVRSHLSEWLIALNGDTQKTTYDHFRQYMDENDRLMVIEVTKRPAWNVGLQGTRAFIDAHFPQ